MSAYWGLELQLFMFLAFRRHMKVVAPEVALSCGTADFLGYKRHKFYEYEIKRSMSDLYRDIHKDDCRKHPHYQGTLDYEKLPGSWWPEAYRNRFRPNYFYFVVTPDIKDEAAAYINQTYPKYGILVYNDTVRDYYGAFSVITKAKALCAAHSEQRQMAVIERIMGRMRSEVGNYYQKLLDEHRKDQKS